MEFKISAAGFLIYLGMALYLAALIVSSAKRLKPARFFIAMAFLDAAVLFAFRWIGAGHLPMQTMFEVFLSLALVVPLISFLGKAIDVPRNNLTLGVDAVIGLLVLFPAGFIFRETTQYLPPALQSPLFGPHVLAYMLAYAIYAKAALLAGLCLLFTVFDKSRVPEYERASYRFACLGFPLLTIGLLLGSVWGKIAWGDWWGWDPKELFSLACWTMYLFYFHWRKLFGLRLPRLNCFWLLMGFVLIILTLLVVNLSAIFPGLHNYAS